MPSTRKILSTGRRNVDNLAPSNWDVLNPLYCANQSNRYINTSITTNLTAGTYMPLQLTPNSELTTQYFCSVIPYAPGPNSYIAVWSVDYTTNTITVANQSTNINVSSDNNALNLRPRTIKEGGVLNYSINLSNNLILTGLRAGNEGVSCNIAFQAMLFNPSTNAVTFGTMANVTISNCYGGTWYQINSTAVILHYSNGINGNSNDRDYLRVVTVNPSTGAITFNTENFVNLFGYYQYGKKNTSGEGAKIFQNQSVVMCNTTMGFIIKAASADGASNVATTRKFTLNGTTVTREGSAGALDRLPGVYQTDIKTNQTNLTEPFPLLRYPVLLPRTSNAGLSNTFCFIDGLYTNSHVIINQVEANYTTNAPKPEGWANFNFPMFGDKLFPNVEYKNLSSVAPGEQFGSFIMYSGEGVGTVGWRMVPSYGLSHYYVKTPGEDIRILCSGSLQFPIENYLQVASLFVNCAPTADTGGRNVFSAQSNSINMIEVQGGPSASGPFYPNSSHSIVSTLQGTDRGIFLTIAANGSSNACQIVFRFLSANVGSQVNTYYYSNTYTVPRNGNAFIQVYGAGGSGNNTSGAPSSLTAYPGGGGGFSYKNMTVTASQNIPITIAGSITVNTMVVQNGGTATESSLGNFGSASGGDLNANGSVGGTQTSPSPGSLPGFPGLCGSPGPAKSGYGWASTQQIYGTGQNPNRNLGSTGGFGMGGTPFRGVRAGGPGVVFIGIK